MQLKLKWEYKQARGFNDACCVLRLGKYIVGRVFWKGGSVTDKNKWQCKAEMSGIVSDLERHESQADAADKLERVACFWLKNLGVCESENDLEFDRSECKHVQRGS